MSTTAARGTTRRTFLRLGALAASAAATDLVRPQRARAAPKKETSPVWRLSTHGRQACNACKAHGANLYFRAPSFAERTRAHAGCNCPVLKQRISKSDYERFFPGGAVVYDKRTGPRKNV